MAEDPNLIERDGPFEGEPAIEGIVIDWRELDDQAALTLEEWRERALYAEERLEKLSEQVATLSRLVFGESSEQSRTRAKSSKKPTPDPGDGDSGDPTDQDNDSTGDDPNGGEPAAGGCGRGQKPGSRGHGRRDYSHIQTREVIHDVPEEQRRCTCCGQEYKFLGSESSDRIDWEVVITRVVHRRLRYHKECTCPGNRTVIGPPAPEPIAKGMFTAGFLGHLIYDKYVLGLPAQRIVRGLAAEGFAVAEGTLCGALKNVVSLLEPVADAIIARNRAAVHVHADETTWRVFADEEADTGKRWWLWVFLAQDTVVFTMDPTRSARVLDEHFGINRKTGALPEGRQRLLLSTDFYTAYQSLARVEGVDPLWCFAHIRRYFIRAGDAHGQLRFWRDQWVARISTLYLAHRTMAAHTPGSREYQRAARGLDQALEAMDTARKAEGQIYSLHPAAKRVPATLDREWEGLVRHRDYPDIALDNNPAERALRLPVVGRKNYYGSQARWAANLAATVWTITATAERNGLEPQAYLTEILTACGRAGSKPLKGPELERLLPWNRKINQGGPGSRDHDPPQLSDPPSTGPTGQGP